MSELEFKKLKRRAALAVTETLRGEIKEHESRSLNWSHSVGESKIEAEKVMHSQWSLEEAFLASVKQTAIDAIESAIVDDDLTPFE